MNSTKVEYFNEEKVCFSWLGSSNPKVKSGHAAFSIDEFKIYLSMESFKEAQELHKFMQDLISFIEQSTRINQKDHLRSTLLKCVREL